LLLILLPFYFGANLLYLNEFFKGTGLFVVRVGLEPTAPN